MLNAVFDKFFLASIAFVAVLASSCEESSPPATPVAGCRTSQTDGKNQASASISLTEDAKIDFQKDILPILSSNKDDEVYKCTTCHAGYTKEETFSTREKIDDIVAQVEGLKMPLNGDEMRKEQIELIKKWAEQKFPTGGGTKPNPGGGSNAASVLDWEDEEWDDAQPSKPASGCDKT